MTNPYGYQHGLSPSVLSRQRSQRPSASVVEQGCQLTGHDWTPERARDLTASQRHDLVMTFWELDRGSVS